MDRVENPLSGPAPEPELSHGSEDAVHATATAAAAERIEIDGRRARPRAVDLVLAPWRAGRRAKLTWHDRETDCTCARRRRDCRGARTFNDECFARVRARVGVSADFLSGFVFGSMGEGESPLPPPPLQRTL